MSSVSKCKSKKPKANRSQTSGPSIRVEETPQELSRELPFQLNKKEGSQNLSLVPPSRSRTASRGPSERGKGQEYLPVLDAITNANIGDQNQSVEVMKNDLGEYFTTADRGMGLVDRAFEEALVDAEDQCVNFPMSISDEISEQTSQGSIEASKCQAQVMPAIDGGVSRERNLDKGKGRDNRVEGLAAMPGHSHHDYDNGISEADGREISRNQFPDIGTPSGQDIAEDVVSQLHGAHHFTIGGNPHFESNRVKHEYYYGNQAGTYDIPILKEHVSFRAIHDSSAQDPTRRVHPGTRQRVLKSIRDWIDTPSAKERIFWLYGPAGVGKSAIAQTIAHSCARERLAATFFFYRSDPSRNDGNRLFTTLAWQLAYSIPATKNALICSLIERPDICTKAVETQFEELIVKPFLELKKSGVRLSAPVVIIDGVDECSDDSLQRRFLKIIGNAVKDDRVPMRFLICSRPEAHIQDTIDIFQSLTLPLDLAQLYDANHDIEKYLRAEFSRIATEQDLDPAWPGEEIIQELVYKASGQFVYASTVIKYVGDEHSNAETQLEIIRGLKPAWSISPFAELDELYKEILRRQRDPVFLKDFLSMFIGRNGIAPLNNLRKDDAILMNVSKKELHRKLRGMRSVLRIEFYIDVHHRSFLDFLQDLSRSGQYHISKQAGTRLYLDFIVGSLVRYASTVIEGHDDHKIHFCPEFQFLASHYPAQIVLPVEGWQQALQPLVDLQNKFLTLANFHCAWELLTCECIGFHVMRNLLLHLALLLGASDRVIDSAVVAEPHADGSEEIHSNIVPLIPTETDRLNALGNDLNTCLSALLCRLRGRKLGILLGADTTHIICSLLRFDHAETAMRLRSMLDAQNFIDAIYEFIINEHFCSNYSADMSYKAVRLALEISARVPVLPRSLFSKGIVGPQHDVWPTTSYDNTPTTELLCQTALMCKILDPSYIVRVLWLYKDDEQLLSVVGMVNENNESLSQWRKRSNPSPVTRIKIMLSVAKAIQYFHSMGIVLHLYVHSNDIFLDSEFHVRFRFMGLTAHFVNVTPNGLLISYEANVFLFGCLFYEMCFGVQSVESNSNAVAERRSMPKIRSDEWQLIQRCRAENPKSRPTMDDVVREMEAWDIT